MTSVEVVRLNEFEIAKPCETQIVECVHEATWAIWCDHHAQGCDYTGFRCDVHFNGLLLETRRMVEAVRRGIPTFCARCGDMMVSAVVEDHTRGIRL